MGVQTQAALTHEWTETLKCGPAHVSLAEGSLEDRASIPEAMRLVIQLGLLGGQPARLGAVRFMNRWAKHHELVHKWQLERALDTWGGPDHPREEWSTGDGSKMYTLRFEMRFHWARQAPSTNWYAVHPELRHVAPTEGQGFWPGMEELQGELDAPQAPHTTPPHTTPHHTTLNYPASP